ncbi:LOW QUALITY PROTEIN: uncharacterized protein LOC108144985 [Drosophila elegans]|uniref:LOW QUALITY PROTEIN: uncharacterized protein LOC108144985 n=1 Tax=Drosophila elegans TaxID=30023 RepID=UPI0007E6541E|nr:LOW QUALITY PROTEIN: uncharacterized protein LOC108144985 [Drosophila elegans]
MSRVSKRIYEAKTAYPDRTKSEEKSFTEVSVPIKKLDTALLLLSSKEECVLLTVFSHITDFARRQDANVLDLRAHRLLELLLEKDLFIDSPNIMIRRFALYLLTALLDNVDMSSFEPEQTDQILELACRFYLMESDDFCIEYLSYILNVCLRDPQMAHGIVEATEFLDKFKLVFVNSENPDTVFNSIEALHRILLVQSAEQMLDFTTQTDFPVDRIICEVTNEFQEIRKAALKTLKTLLADTGDDSVFEPLHRCFFVLEQLVKAFCENPRGSEAADIIDVLATALRSEKMTNLFFEQNLFDLVVEQVRGNMDLMPLEMRCTIISIFAETAQYEQFLPRMHKAEITDMFLSCLMQNKPAPAAFVIQGLQRMSQYPDSLRRIVAAYEEGAIRKLVTILMSPEVAIKVREQAAELIARLLVAAFRDTAAQLQEQDIAAVLTAVITQGQPTLSIDLILSLLTIVESLAQNEEYRTILGAYSSLTEQIAQLLMRSYAHSILVNNIFRCLCTLIDEAPVRETLLANYIVSSIKRALKSLSNLVKTSVTNFILQTTRFNEFIDAYIDRGILEVLLDFQKHAFCVSTWAPAIESILSKCPTMKFAIRNCLNFTDITAGKDFYVSRRKFEDIRSFQDILRNDCSPLDAVLVMNFDRPKPDATDVIDVPLRFMHTISDSPGDQCWNYCKRPGDVYLPQYLEALNQTLAMHGLVENPERIRRSVDFDNVAKRSKLIAQAVFAVMNDNLKIVDLNSTEECSRDTVRCHLQDLRQVLHTNFIPLGMVRSGCQFERAVLFKGLADQIGLPCTLQRSVDGRMLYNEVPLPVEPEKDVHCDKKTLKFMPWRMLRPTHVVDLMYNVGELYPMQSRQALQYLRLY